MMTKQLAIKAAMVAAALTLGGALTAAPAVARVVVGVGVGLPFYAAPYPYAYPYPYGYYPYPPPVVYAPPVVVPATPAYVSQPTQSLYYCDDPKGYYPNVQSCAPGWRQVPAQPAH
jgi:hypothetical protein